MGLSLTSEGAKWLARCTAASINLPDEQLGAVPYQLRIDLVLQHFSREDTPMRRMAERIVQLERAVLDEHRRIKLAGGRVISPGVPPVTDFDGEPT